MPGRRERAGEIRRMHGHEPVGRQFAPDEHVVHVGARLQLIERADDVRDPHAGPVLKGARPMNVALDEHGILERRADRQHAQHVARCEGDCGPALREVHVHRDALALLARALDAHE